MPSEWLYAIASVTLVSLLSLIGAVAIALNERTLRRTLFILVSLAAGVMFGDTFIHILPQVYERRGSSVAASVFVLAGIFGFFM